MATANTTQQFVPVREVRDGIVILESGKMAVVLLASSINLALKSADEQQAVLGQFQAFLNTLDFSLQVYVQSRELDVKPYLEKLRGLEAQQGNELMQVQLREYVEFIRAFTAEVDIMKKQFFVVVSYTPAPVNIRAGIKGLVPGKKAAAPIEEHRFEEQRGQLEQRVAIVEQGLARVGVRTLPLGDNELVELYYQLFNPLETSGAPSRA